MIGGLNSPKPFDERSPLLPDGDNELKREKSRAEIGTAHRFTVIKAMASRLVHRDTVVDSMTYHTQELTSWKSLFHFAHTVWRRKSLWQTATNLFLLSLFVALSMVFFVKDPGSLKVGKFSKISDFLRVFVGLLLGFFMSASVNRWWNCVEGFVGLCGSVRKLQMTLNACGVGEENIETCLRYGVISSWILHLELHFEALPPEEQKAALHKGWTRLRSGSEIGDAFVLTPAEADMLEMVSDPAGTLWAWIGGTLGRFAEEGSIHTLAAPSFARCMTISESGLDNILRVRNAISVQAPYIYVQMLAALVHINNMVCALSFGLTVGGSVGTLLAYHHVHYFTSEKATSKEAVVDTQYLFVSFVLSCFGPFIYQALLEVGIAIAQPFSNCDAVVPTQRIVETLQRDLADATRTLKYIRGPQGTQGVREAPRQNELARSSTAPAGDYGHATGSAGHSGEHGAGDGADDGDGGDCDGGGGGDGGA